MATRELPIQHLSYSAVCCYLRNRADFKKRYIDKIYDEKESPTTVVGKAFHKCLELFYSGVALRDAGEAGAQLIESRSANVEWGKTGSPDKALEEYRQTVAHYFSEEHGYAGNLQTEKTLIAHFRGWKLPLKVISDLIVHRDDGSYYIVDFKKVATLEEDMKPEYWIQFAFNVIACRKTFGRYPEHMIFHQVKTSKNKDGSPQNRKLQMVVDDPLSQKMIQKVKELSNAIVAEVSRKNNSYLPNISDMFSGSDSWAEYAGLTVEA